MTQALIGCSGFVGGMLMRGGAYNALFNSSNIDSIRGCYFERVVCAGVSARKWRANQDPSEDWAAIDRLKSALAEVRAKHFTLISTVDVYPDPCCVDEGTSIDRGIGQPYGRHRLALEDWVSDRFPHVLIVRLPALFGPGLKKNVIFDMLNDNLVDRINGASSFQWYDLEWLSADLAIAEEAMLDRINFAVGPLVTQDIADALFPSARINFDPSTAVHYDMRTLHAKAFGSTGYYLHSREDSFVSLAKFVQSKCG